MKYIYAVILGVLISFLVAALRTAATTPHPTVAEIWR